MTQKQFEKQIGKITALYHRILAANIAGKSEKVQGFAEKLDILHGDLIETATYEIVKASK